jgi:hypothetical protein
MVNLLRQLLISIDQFAQVVVFGIPYIITGKGKCPNADETISSYVGRKSLKGSGWAKLVEKPINFVFGLLDEDNHCFNSIENF